LLINRGIPFVEKTVTSAADISAFTALTGGERSLPVSTIGKQMLRGLNATDWHAYLDAAGYPKTSKLPSTYRMPQPQSLAGAASPAPSAAGAQDESPSAPARRSRRAPAQEEQPGANPTGIRF
jgi:hypothetical protein